MPPRGTGPRRTDRERQRDYVTIARLYLTGHTQDQIATLLSTQEGYEPRLTPITIQHDLQAIRTAWLQSSLTDFNAHRAKELARIDLVEEEAWKAWQRTQETRETTTTQQTTPAKGASSLQATIRREPRTGDGQYLQIVLQCVRQRSMLLGLDAPIRVDIEQRARALAQELDLDEHEVLAIAEDVLKRARKEQQV